MKSKCLEYNSNHSNGVAEDSAGVKSSGSAMHGDVVWVRIRGSLWWPAQVVDEKLVSRSRKPKKNYSNEVLVRLYGTYAYLYRDLVKAHSGFEKVLKKNNGSYRETFKKALEQDLSHKKPTTLKRNVGEPREEAGAETPKDKRSKPNDASKTTDQKLDSPGSVTPSLKLSVRRVKVMQSLGLVAPLGSPFQKSGVSNV